MSQSEIIDDPITSSSLVPAASIRGWIMGSILAVFFIIGYVRIRTILLAGLGFFLLSAAHADDNLPQSQHDGSGPDYGDDLRVLVNNSIMLNTLAFWGLLLAFAMLLHVRNNSVLFVVFGVVFIIILYETQAQVQHFRLLGVSALPEIEISQSLGENWVKSSATARMSPIGGWLLGMLVVLWVFVRVQMVEEILNICLEQIE